MNLPGDEFLGNAPKFEKPRKFRSVGSLNYGRQINVSKSLAARAKYFFVLFINLPLFDVLAAADVVVAEACSRRSDSRARCFPIIPSFFPSQFFSRALLSELLEQAKAPRMERCV